MIFRRDGMMRSPIPARVVVLAADSVRPDDRECVGRPNRLR
jgi:hypothetical protein